MIKISEDILTVTELEEASGKKKDDIDIEITNIAVSKIAGGKSVALNIDAKLNFVMPKKTENLMKKRILSRIASAERIRINYMYTGVMIPKKSDNYDGDSYNGGGYSGNGGGEYRRKKKEEPAFENSKGELILNGRDFDDDPVSYCELAEYVGRKDRPVIEGEVFSIEAMPIKNGRELITILIASEAGGFSFLMALQRSLPRISLPKASFCFRIYPFRTRALAMTILPTKWFLPVSRSS